MLEARALRFAPDSRDRAAVLTIPTPRHALRDAAAGGASAPRIFVFSPISPLHFWAWSYVGYAYDDAGIANVKRGIARLAELGRRGPPVLAVPFPYFYAPAYDEWGFERFHVLPAGGPRGGLAAARSLRAAAPGGLHHEAGASRRSDPSGGRRPRAGRAGDRGEARRPGAAAPGRACAVVRADVARRPPRAGLALRSLNRVAAGGPTRAAASRRPPPGAAAPAAPLAGRAPTGRHRPPTFRAARSSRGSWRSPGVPCGAFGAPRAALRARAAALGVLSSRLALLSDHRTACVAPARGQMPDVHGAGPDVDPSRSLRGATLQDALRSARPSPAARWPARLGLADKPAIRVSPGASCSASCWSTRSPSPASIRRRSPTTTKPPTSASPACCSSAARPPIASMR